MIASKNDSPLGDDNKDASVLHGQAWNYFNTHAAQRMTVFNFYIALSSVTATGYVASFRSDSNLTSVRWIIALFLCFFAFVFWKLDQRVKVLIKNAENVLKYFEAALPHEVQAKVFTLEEAETDIQRQSLKGWHRIQFWRIPLSYSRCFNLVYSAFFLLGFGALIQAVFSHFDCIR